MKKYRQQFFKKRQKLSRLKQKTLFNRTICFSSFILQIECYLLKLYLWYRSIAVTNMAPPSMSRLKLLFFWWNPCTMSSSSMSNISSISSSISSSTWAHRHKIYSIYQGLLSKHFWFCKNTFIYHSILCFLLISDISIFSLTCAYPSACISDKSNGTKIYTHKLWLILYEAVGVYPIKILNKMSEKVRISTWVHINCVSFWIVYMFIIIFNKSMVTHTRTSKCTYRNCLRKMSICCNIQSHKRSKRSP